MIKGIISTGSYIIKLLINIYQKFYKSTAAVREEVYIGVFHRKILIFAWMFSRINSVILGGINMSEITVIALDAMGGDNAPGEMVKGAVDALGREQDIKVYLLGKEDIVNAELQKYTYDKNRLNRDCRTSGECDQKKERFFYCSRNEDGKGRKG